MKKRLWLRLASVGLLPVFSFLPISPAHSATVGSGNCVQTVGSATGVTVTTYSNRCVVKFTSTVATTWSVPRGVTKIWVLVVGGGGGGGSDEGGGGGAGGFVQNQNFAVTSQSSIALDVGLGGIGATDAGGLAGGDGGNSIFGSLTADGGGGAGSAVNASSTLKDGRDGGSGGGGAGEGGTYRLGTGGSATSGQGFAGGAGYTGRGGGGGGAAEVGNANGASMGGDGKSTLILDGATSTYFAGGGGGGGGNYGTNLSVVGGSGGGGAGGGGSTCPTAGSANTGGGGGGGGSCNSYTGANGGSGIIVVNYQFDTTAPQVVSSTAQTVVENSSLTTNILSIVFNESTTASIAASQDGADFTLVYSDSLTSLLRFSSPPDFETPADIGGNNEYNFTLNLEDYSGNTATQAFVITVTDINDAPVITAFSGAATASYTVAENASALYNINATDQDTGTTLTYSLSGNDSSDFIISSNGVLSFNPAADFEDARDSNGDNVYIVITWVSDGALSDSQTTTITVTNLNESGTVSTPSLSAAAYKGITVTISVAVNAHGKVLFTANGKRIPNCLSVRTTGTYPVIAATCNWKPNVTGRINLQASLTPTSNTYSASSSERVAVWVLKRSTTR